MKEFLYTAAGITGSFLAMALGGWDTALHTLIIFMAIDVLFGLILALFYKRSRKSTSGCLNASTAQYGLFKKGGCLALVLVGYRLDLMIGSDFVRTAVIIALISTELLSIIENAGLMGIPMPTALHKALEVLNSKGAI